MTHLLLHLCVYLWSLFKLGLQCQHSAGGCQSLYQGHTTLVSKGQAVGQNVEKR